MQHELLKSLGHKPRKGKVFKCVVCNKSFYRKPSHCTPIPLYCSYKCRGISQQNRVYLICKFCGKQYYRQKSTIKWALKRGKRVSFCSKQCQRSWVSESLCGENSPSWKGGISPKNRRLRASRKWKAWRKAVFARDNWTCQECGIHSGDGKTIILHPHHIKPFAYYPKLRFDVKNGKTLCIECHKKVHNKEGWGYEKNNKTEATG